MLLTLGSVLLLAETQDERNARCNAQDALCKDDCDTRYPGDTPKAALDRRDCGKLCDADRLTCKIGGKPNKSPYYKRKLEEEAKKNQTSQPKPPASPWH